MNVSDAINGRRSIRSYEDRPIEPDALDRIIDASRRAPSARNLQEWRFVVVTDVETRSLIMKAAGGQSFVGQAPAVIACCAETDGRVMKCGQQTYPIDVAIAIDHMVLAAWELGIGSCWVGHFDEAQVKGILDIPEAIRVVQLLPIGYPAEQPDARDRKPMDQIAFFERWNGTR